MDKIPPEAWAVLGPLLIANLGTVWAVLKQHFNRDTQLALLNQRIDFILQSQGKIEAAQTDLKKDIDAAFRTIRESKNIGA